MKKILLIASIALNVCIIASFAYVKRGTIHNMITRTDSIQGDGSNKYAYSDFRRDMYARMQVDTSDIVFIGNSITEYFPVTELFNNIHIKNRGISGNNSYDILDRIKDIAKGNPKKVYFMDGINDIIMGINPDSSFANYRKIFASFNPKKTKVIIQTMLPDSNPKHKDAVIEYNTFFRTSGFEIIDLYPLFATKEGTINNTLTIDGIHPNDAGYKVWESAINSKINN